MGEAWLTRSDSALETLFEALDGAALAGAIVLEPPARADAELDGAAERSSL
jgi:hypothetical protein